MLISNNISYSTGTSYLWYFLSRYFIQRCWTLTVKRFSREKRILYDPQINHRRVLHVKPPRESRNWSFHAGSSRWKNRAGATYVLRCTITSSYFWSFTLSRAAAFYTILKQNHLKIFLHKRSKCFYA